MTLVTKSSQSYKVKLYNKLNLHLILSVILISCLGTTTAILISFTDAAKLFTILSFTPSSSSDVASTLLHFYKTTDLGSVSGSVMSSNGLPVGGALVEGYKQLGLVGSVDKSTGYSTFVMTKPDGSYLLSGLPSGIYKFIVTYPDGVIQTINEYAVWPSSSSSHSFYSTVCCNMLTD